MRNEYKLFLLESIVLSVIFTACCSSGSNRFYQEVWACRLERERISLYIETFRFEMLRIKAIFIHSTTNGYRHLMKSGRVACRPIEGEEIPTYRDFSV